MVYSPWSALRTLSALIYNYGDVLAVIFFHHRDKEDTETRFLFAHRETAMDKKPETSVKPSLLIETYIYAPASILFVCR